jgi:hypothetical protein
MSRVGKLPVPIPSGVTVVVEDERVIRVKGPNGELTHPVLVGTQVVVDGAEARVSSERVVRNPAFGTMRAKLNNMVLGVTTGFSKNLEIQGTGYRAAMDANTLVLAFHPLRGSAGHHRQGRDSYADQGERRGQGAGRPGRREHPWIPPARALQGQGRALRGRIRPSQGR